MGSAPARIICKFNSFCKSYMNKKSDCKYTTCPAMNDGNLPVSVLFLTRDLGWSQSYCRSRDTVSSVHLELMVSLCLAMRESRFDPLALVVDKTVVVAITTTWELWLLLSLIRKIRLNFSSSVRSATLFAVLPWFSWPILLEEAVTLLE